MSRLDEIRARNEAARAEYTNGVADQAVRDTDHLLERLDAVQKLAAYLETLAPGDQHYAGLIRAAITPPPPTESPIMPRGAWLWPDDRTGPEWMTKHDERL